MKPYGIPRTLDTINPDLADIHYFGLKSSAGNLPHHGTIKNSFRKSACKRAVRRAWKKKARMQGRALCRKEAQEVTWPDIDALIEEINHE